jgi:hypothetical protein
MSQREKFTAFITRKLAGDFTNLEVPRQSPLVLLVRWVVCRAMGSADGTKCEMDCLSMQQRKAVECYCTGAAL